MADQETRQLLERAAAGDEQAVQTLFRENRRRLRGMVAVRMDQRMAGRVDPSDVVQEALTIASQRLVDFLNNRPMEFYPWLRQIGWNCLVDAHRRHVLADRRSVDREISIDPALSSQSAATLVNRLVSTGTSPTGRLDREEQRSSVLDALEHLSGTSREVLVLRFLEQLSVTESAQVLGISENALKARQVRAIQQLRDVLGTSLEDLK